MSTPKEIHDATYGKFVLRIALDVKRVSTDIFLQDVYEKEMEKKESAIAAQIAREADEDACAREWERREKQKRNEDHVCKKSTCECTKCDRTFQICCCASPDEEDICQNCLADLYEFDYTPPGFGVKICMKCCSSL